MKVLLFCTLFVFVSSGLSMAGDVYVNGYTRNNGTYVQPYHRTAPDNNFNNNYSTRPNINPYTGQEGTRVAPPQFGPTYGPMTNPNPYGKNGPGF